MLYNLVAEESRIVIARSGILSSGLKSYNFFLQIKSRVIETSEFARYLTLSENLSAWGNA